VSRQFPALKIALHVPDEQAFDAIVADLLDFQPTAVDEQDGALRIFFVSADARDRARGALQDREELHVESIDVPDEDWAARSQAHLTAVRVGRIVVTPPWVSPDRGLDDLVIVIQPSMGFGTAHHATTRLCLRLLQPLNLNGASVLDVGTGSGVLAIAAARLGAARVVAIDNDPDALASARENVGLNEVGGRVSLQQVDLSSLPQAPSPTPQAVFDLVLANLTAAVLIAEASVLARSLRSGGSLIVSGYERQDTGLVHRALASSGAIESDRQDEDGWCAARFTIPRSSTAR
jgi:ribosomal protein L11 methyltransferase